MWLCALIPHKWQATLLPDRSLNSLSGRVLLLFFFRYSLRNPQLLYDLRRGDNGPMGNRFALVE
jgi:hypothetical protein